MTTLSNSAAQDGKLARPAAAWVVFFLGAIIYLGNAGFPGLLDDADASHAMVSWEMLQRHDPVILYMNGIRYLMKAPLHYWAVAVSYGIFGRTEFATRLPVALAMIGLALLVNSFAGRYFGVRSGLYSALAVLTGAGFFLFTRITIPEGIYALEFTAIFYLFLRGWTRSLEPRLAYWGVAVVTALAMLTRGLVGVIFPAAILGLFILATRGWRRLKELHLISSTLIFLSVAAPWHVLASLQAKTFFWSYFINEHFKRAVGTRYPPDYEAVPLWLWLGAHLIWLFPWSIFLVSALRGVGKPSSWKDLSTEQQARLLLILWGGFILLFFSLTFGSRMEYYSFGGWPAMAMLLGLGLARAEERGGAAPRRLSLALAVLAAVYAAAATAFLAAMGAPTGDVTADLRTHEVDFYQSAMARALDLTPQALADLRTPVLLSAAGLLAAFVAGWRLRIRGRPVAATVATAAGMAVLLAAAELAYGDLSPSLSSRELAE